MNKFQKAAHFLTGRSGVNGSLKQYMGDSTYLPPVIDDVDGNNGIYLSTYTAFLEHKLTFGVYVRNTFTRGGEAISGAKKSIKFQLSLATPVPGATYRSYKGGQSNAVDLDTQAVANLAKALEEGVHSPLQLETIGGETATLRSDQHCLVFSVPVNGVHSNVSLGFEQIFQLRMCILEYCSFISPEIDPETTFNQLVKAAGGLIPNKNGFNNYNHRSVTSHSLLSNLIEKMNGAIDATSLEMAIGSFSESDVTEKTKKCLWAIGNKKWNHGQAGLELIKIIQNNAGEELAREIVEEVNKGNTQFLDRMLVIKQG